MVKKHLKTLTAPKSWPIKRKGQKFIIRPHPGKSFLLSMPLALIFKDILKLCKTTKEVKAILRDKEVLVDGKRRLSPKYLVGIMDVLSIPISNEYFRMFIGKKLQIVKISKNEATTKICKIIGKTLLKKGIIQLNLFDGRCINIKKDAYKVGDSLLIALPSQEIKDHLKLDKGSFVYLIQGKHVGNQGTVTQISSSTIVIKTKDKEFETPKDYVYVIGKQQNKK